jgi:hypothetical protein
VTPRSTTPSFPQRGTGGRYNKHVWTSAGSGSLLPTCAHKWSSKQQISVQQQVHGRLPNPAATLCLPSPFVQANRPTHMKKQEKTVSTPPYRRRRLLSHVWDTMPCSQDRSGKAQPHDACSESQPRSAQELLPCHAMPSAPCHGSQPEITHPPSPSTSIHGDSPFFFPPHLSISCFTHFTRPARL